jgi:hypothetical protein
VLGAAVVPVLVGVVVAVGVVVLGVAGAGEPAVVVVVVGLVPVDVSPVPGAVSEPHPSNASVITAQALTLRRSAKRDVEPLSVALFISKIMSASKDPPIEVNRLNRTSTTGLAQKRSDSTKPVIDATRSHGISVHTPIKIRTR